MTEIILLLFVCLFVLLIFAFSMFVSLCSFQENACLCVSAKESLQPKKGDNQTCQVLAGRITRRITQHKEAKKRMFQLLINLPFL